MNGTSTVYKEAQMDYLILSTRKQIIMKLNDKHNQI